MNDAAVSPIIEAPTAAARVAAPAIAQPSARPMPPLDARLDEATILPPPGNLAPIPITDTPFTWMGSPWRLFGTCLFNALMTIATIGVYSFWGRTEIRRRMWSSVRLHGEPLVYHGTGTELFKGFLAALLIVLLPIFLIGTATVIAFGQASSGWGIYQGALFLIVYPVLKTLATYRARRYRLARTSWRGIRGNVNGSAGEFAFLSWATSLLYPLTIGWIAPWRALYIQRFLIGDTMLGDRKLEMKGSTASLYWRFGILWIGTIILFAGASTAVVAIIGPEKFASRSPLAWGTVTRTQWAETIAIIVAALFVWSLISSFYRSSLYNLSANATFALPPGQPGAATWRFNLATRGRHLIWLYVTNQLITYGSLFVLRPIATARSMKYFAEHLSITGPFDPSGIRQNSNAAVTEGEGLAQAFDFDAF